MLYRTGTTTAHTLIEPGRCVDNAFSSFFGVAGFLAHLGKLGMDSSIFIKIGAKRIHRPSSSGPHSLPLVEVVNPSFGSKRSAVANLFDLDFTWEVTAHFTA